MVLLCAISIGTKISRGASIGFNFVSDREAAGALGVADAAGVVPKVSWNNFTGIPGNATGLSDTEVGIDSPNSGVITDDAGTTLPAVTVNWSARNSWNTNNGTGNEDNRMMNGYLDTGSGDPINSLSIGNLPASYTENGGYTVIAYFGSDGNGRTGTVGVTGGDTFSFSTSSQQGGGFPGSYVRTTDTGNGNPLSNYAMWEGLTTDALTVTLTRVGGNCGLHGIQIIGPDAPVGIASLENSPAVSITTNSATLQGTVTDIGTAAPTVTIFYGDDDAGTESNDWDDSVTLAGTQSGAFSAGVGGLLPGTTYFFRAQATNASGVSWAPDTASFETVPLAPIIATLSATDIQTTSAVVASDVTDTGGEIPIVTIYWGTSDGGTNAGAWANTELVGAQSGVGSATLSGLQTGTTYFYRAFASNGGGSSWAPTSESFATEQPVPPSVENRFADGISGTSANLRGEVTNIGFDSPTVSIYYGLSDGGTNVANWDSVANLGVHNGDFSVFRSGLDPLTTYYYRARATNVAGTSWAPSTASFDTTDLVSGAIVINEIHYDHEPKTQLGEFVEIYNASDSVVDLSGWKLNGVDYTFPQGASIGANGFVVVAEDPTTIQGVFGVSALGPYAGKLSNDGDRIELEDSVGARIDIVDYGIGFPWPTSSRGAGASMELINETLDNDLGSSWRGSQSGFSGPQVTYVPAGSNWSYRKGTSEASSPIDLWRETGFVQDGTWLAGTTVIGYGDGDDETLINDMSNGYASVFLRKEFAVSGAIPNQLLVRVYHDDGAIVWINGVEVARINVDQGEVTFEGDLVTNPRGRTSAVSNHEAAWTEVNVLGAGGFLVDGVNTVAIHGFNSTFGSSDFSIDCEIKTPSPSDASVGVPTPGAANSVFSPVAPPNIRQVRHLPEQPISGEDVVITARVTDPEGVASVTLGYQLVEPGNYIRLTDAAYETNWTDVAMVDDGTGSDLIAGDSIYTGVMAGTFQVHRRLVRYRITVEDIGGTAVQTPFADDESPNFAYFCYDGVPDWTGSKRPGNLPNATYSADALDDVAVYHLITRESDVILCQWTGPTDSVYRYLGTWVYDGKVYDHMRYRIRGQGSTRQVGKNKWKFNFNRARPLEARDDYGKKYNVPWDKINGLPSTNPWWRDNASTDGTIFSESLGFRMYQLAGGVGSNTHFYHFRIIDKADEAPAGDQYDGDFWGLYVAIEQPEAEFLSERGLPGGNIYNVHGGAGGSSLRNQGATQVTDKSDLTAFQNRHVSGTTQAQWESILDFEDYFAWNAMNLAINNSDLRPQENVNYYHNSETDKWHVLPWDLDLTFEDAPHLGRGDTPAWERIYHCLQYPTINQQYENQVRHILDLLLDNDQSGHLVEEYAGFVTGGVVDNLVEANQAVWDYHPRKNKKGIWYANFNTGLLPSRTFDSLTQYTKDFLTVGGYGRNNLASKQVDGAIPNKPTIAHTGATGFPTDDLTFESSSFSDPQGNGTFGSMEWRVGEIHNKDVASYIAGDRYVYEIETFYQTERMTPFQAQFTFPPSEVRVGKTYRARVRHIDSSGRASHWSDAIEFTATEPDLSPWQNNLMITELMYHPLDATPTEIAAGYTSSDFEYLELQNISTTLTLDLTDLRFTKGVDFDFVDGAITSLAPGEYVILARNVAAFELRYGVGLPVAGGYGPDSLSNGGENVKLSFGAGTAIHEFTYDDKPAWPTTPDGEGFSLTLIRPQDAPDHADPLNWRASGAIGGTPGDTDGRIFSGDPNADDDGDGIVALVEYYFGESDSDATHSRPWDSQLVESDGSSYLGVSFTAAVGADDVSADVEISNDLSTWRSGAGEVEVVSETPNGDGTTTFVFRSANPISATVREFLRIRLTLQ